MKLLKVSIAAAIGSILWCGCISKGLVSDLSKDNATVSANVNTIYGTVKIIRSNPQTNQSVTIAPDGTVTIKPN